MPKVKVVEVRNPPPPPAPPPLVPDDDDYMGWWAKECGAEVVPQYLQEMLGNMANAGMLEIKPQPKALPLPKEKKDEPRAEGPGQGSGDDPGLVTVCNPEGYL